MTPNPVFKSPAAHATEPTVNKIATRIPSRTSRLIQNLSRIDLFTFFNQSPFSIAGNTLPLLDAEVCPHFDSRAGDPEHCFPKCDCASAAGAKVASGSDETGGAWPRLGAGKSPSLLDHGQRCELEGHHACRRSELRRAHLARLRSRRS